MKSIITTLESIKASIYDIEHERSTVIVPVGFVQVTITFNLQDSSQIATILDELDKKGMRNIKC